MQNKDCLMIRWSFDLSCKLMTIKNCLSSNNIETLTSVIHHYNNFKKKNQNWRHGSLKHQRNKLMK